MSGLMTRKKGKFNDFFVFLSLYFSNDLLQVIMAFTFNCMIVSDFSIFLKQMYGIECVTSCNLDIQLEM